MKILSKRHKEFSIEHTLEFHYPDEHDYGFAFPCDKDGKVMFGEMTDAGIENYQNCINGIYNVIPCGVSKHTWSYIEPAVGKCDCCGREVRLVDDYCGATECKCGQWYAVGGYAISSPEMWEDVIDCNY